MTKSTRMSMVATFAAALAGCGGGSGSSADTTAATTVATVTTADTSIGVDATDISDAVFTKASADCGDYADRLAASVLDIKRGLGFDASVTIASSVNACTLVSNNIPNHDFNDATAAFATNVAEVGHIFDIPRNPTPAPTPTALDHRTYDGIMLNGVPIDILSAGCYDPDNPMADPDGNVAIGCDIDDDWLLDPLGVDHKFGVDAHNAHTQPDGSYHYHGHPRAMFDDNPGPDGSPVIGFAADGFPVFGSYFYDTDTGQVRKAISGYTLRSGQRPSDQDDPGGTYDGTYVDDWEWTGAGDLDECNGMTVNGQYGYYVTDAYPWLMACLTGIPDASFGK